MNSTASLILIVDDEAMIRLNLCAFLEDEGFSIFSAESSEVALQLLERQQIHLSIVDIRLPGMDGNQFILRAHSLYPRMKYLIHTGSSSYQLPVELLALGMLMDDVFMKPIADMLLLVQAIRKKLP
jgi:two-component system, OmpR family, response regulator